MIEYNTIDYFLVLYVVCIMWVHIKNGLVKVPNQL